MLIMFLVVMGVFSFVDLGVDLFPKSDPATVNVRIRLPGASPEEMVSQVILPLEENIAAVAGIDEMVARVTEGSANITVQFVLERDIGEAAEDAVATATRAYHLARDDRRTVVLNLPVAVHLFYLSDAKAVLDAGADFIAHSVRDVDVDEELIAALKKRDVCYTTKEGAREPRPDMTGTLESFHVPDAMGWDLQIGNKIAPNR